MVPRHYFFSAASLLLAPSISVADPVDNAPFVAAFTDGRNPGAAFSDLSPTGFTLTYSDANVAEEERQEGVSAIPAADFSETGSSLSLSFTVDASEFSAAKPNQLLRFGFRDNSASEDDGETVTVRTSLELNPFQAFLFQQGVRSKFAFAPGRLFDTIGSFGAGEGSRNDVFNRNTPQQFNYDFSRNIDRGTGVGDPQPIEFGFTITSLGLDEQGNSAFELTTTIADPSVPDSAVSFTSSTSAEAGIAGVFSPDEVTIAFGDFGDSFDNDVFVVSNVQIEFTGTPEPD